MQFEEVLQLQVLRAKAGYDNARLTDRLIESLPEGDNGIRQMCAKVSIQLIEDLNEVCTRLDMSKRQFIEAAVIDAVKRAHEVMERHGLDEVQGSL